MRLNVCISMLLVLFSLLHKVDAQDLNAAEKNEKSLVKISCVRCATINHNNVLLLIHGLGSSSNIWGESARLIGDIADADVYTVDYPTSFTTNNNDVGLDELSAPLIKAIRSSEISNRKLTVIAHSQGGILALRAILDHLTSHNIEKLIILGSPLRGAPAANSILFGVLSKQAKDLKPDSALLTDMRLDMKAYSKHLPKILTVSGDSDDYASDVSVYSEQAINKRLPLDHNDLANLSDPRILVLATQFFQDKLKTDDFKEAMHTKHLTVCIPELSSIVAYRHYRKDYLPKDSELVEQGYFKLLDPVSPDFPYRVGTPSVAPPAKTMREKLLESLTDSKLRNECIEGTLVSKVNQRDRDGRVISSTTSAKKISCPSESKTFESESRTFGIWIKTTKAIDFKTDIKNMRGDDILSVLREKNINYQRQEIEITRDIEGTERAKLNIDLSPFLAEYFRSHEIVTIETPTQLISYKIPGKSPSAYMGDDGCVHLRDVQHGIYRGDLIDIFKQAKKAWDIDTYNMNFMDSTIPFVLDVEVNSLAKDVLRHAPIELINKRSITWSELNKR